MTVRTLLTFITVVACAQAQNGEALFKTKCAACHNSANAVGAPLPETLHKMPWRAILEALETGKMKGIGDGLGAADREAIAKYSGSLESAPLTTEARCVSGKAPSTSFPDWNGWADPANTRFQPASAAGLTRQTAPKLKLKWAFGFPGVQTAFGTPTISGGRVLVGAADGTVYALDARTGCTWWSYAAQGGVRAAPVVSKDGGTAYVGDLRGNVYALRTSTGAVQWKVRAEEHPMAVITGSPKLEAGRLYVPVSGRDESIAATNSSYECCTFRGSVVALDAATGKRVWQAYTVSDPPKVTGTNAKGVKTWGPSGAVVWSSPTLDLKKRVIYAGTGVNYSQPTTNTSDAIVAIDMDSGHVLWSRQFTGDDAYNFACVGADKTNCPRDPFVDVDFGNSPILRQLAGGKRILVAGDKGGVVYAIDPDRQGEIVWKKKVASGGLNGGFMWGGASDEQGIAYLGISDFTAGQPEKGGGLIALQLATGEKLWMSAAPKPACGNAPGCSAAQPAPVTVIPGVAFLGSWDGHMRGYETRTGAIIWDFDTLRDFATVNGVKARGGSINSMGPAIAGGMVFTTAGYSGTALPGNVLLAFSVDGR